MAKKYIILDRDGTIIHDKDYLSRPSEVELLPNAVKGLRQFQRLGYGLIMITNQSGVARGYFTEETVKAVNDELLKQLKAEGVTFDGVYYCPHGPDDNCSCRKPNIGLAKEAAKVFNFKMDKCIVIGDKASDVEMGKNMKALTILVRTGKGIEEEAKCQPDMVADNLTAAARMIGLASLLDEMSALEEKLLQQDHLNFMKEATTNDLLRCF
ncbi:MAG: D-glycero-alpha-D-manno-heptose-1,7-bisphosphate 7-phosphatase [Alphaproteobacteria bacterium]